MMWRQNRRLKKPHPRKVSLSCTPHTKGCGHYARTPLQHHPYSVPNPRHPFWHPQRRWVHASLQRVCHFSYVDTSCQKSDTHYQRLSVPLQDRPLT